MSLIKNIDGTSTPSFGIGGPAPLIYIDTSNLTATPPVGSVLSWESGTLKFRDPTITRTGDWTTGRDGELTLSRSTAINLG
jgi:hypothetical protein